MSAAAAAPPDAGAARTVDFYVLPGNDARTRLRLACRLTEQAYLSQRRVLIWSDDAAELGSFDELLWTFADRAFVPHELCTGSAQWSDSPVLLSGPGQQLPTAPYDVLVNLGRTVPPAAAGAARIVEIVDADEQRRQSGRERFRAYREQGLAPQTHHLADDQPP
jgi:DNA polymerase III subunit chi